MKPHQDSAICQTIMSAEAHEQLVRQYTAVGTDPAVAGEVVDVAFHAAREGYDRLVYATAVASVPGATLMLAVQLLGHVLRETSDAGLRVLAGMGADVSETVVRTHRP